MRTAPESRKISTILRLLREESLQPQADFQRRAVWTNKDKIAFIETILMGYPFPEIYVASGDVDTETGESTELLVDGQQRVRTMDEYFRGVSPFSRTQQITRYAQLTEDEKRNFLNYDVSVRNLGIISIDEIRTVFQRMNRTSYDLNDMERYNAAYLGAFKQFCERIAQEEFFQEHRVFSAADIRRMKDVSFAASLTATMMSDYFHRDDEVEEYLDQYNEEFEAEEDIYSRYTTVFGALDEMDFPRGSRAWKKADFYTLFIELDRALNRNGMDLDRQAVADRLKAFFDQVDAMREEDVVPEGDAGEYFRATLQSTNDRGARVTRGNALRAVITAG
jgi:hypothetical protein